MVDFPAEFTATLTVLVFGGEATEISQEVLDLADTVVAVPMLGMANSLNVSTAAAILLWAKDRMLRVSRPLVDDQ